MENLVTVDLREERSVPYKEAVYFRDKNAGKFVEEYIPTDSCAGDGGCIRVLKDTHFEWKNKLLLSTRFDISFNYDKYFKAYIKEMGLCENGLWIKVDMPLEQGDILVPQRNADLECYVSYADYWENNGGYILKLRKMEDDRTYSRDDIFEAFKPGRAVNVIGQLR